MNRRWTKDDGRTHEKDALPDNFKKDRRRTMDEPTNRRKESSVSSSNMNRRRTKDDGRRTDEKNVHIFIFKYEPTKDEGRWTTEVGHIVGHSGFGHFFLGQSRYWTLSYLDMKSWTFRGRASIWWLGVATVAQES